MTTAKEAYEKVAKVCKEYATILKADGGEVLGWAVSQVAIECEKRIRSLAAQEAESTCHWRADSDGIWDTDCKNSFVFEADGPNDNGCEYCCYCGKPLIEVPYISPWDEDDKAESATQQKTGQHGQPEPSPAALAGTQNGGMTLDNTVISRNEGGGEVMNAGETLEAIKQLKNAAPGIEGTQEQPGLARSGPPSSSGRPAPDAAPDMPVYAKTHYIEVPALGMRRKMVCIEDYDALRAAFERVARERDELNRTNKELIKRYVEMQELRDKQMAKVCDARQETSDMQQRAESAERQLANLRQPGHVWVPVEPTEEMKEAGVNALNEIPVAATYPVQKLIDANKCYRAMLAAARREHAADK